MAAKKHTISDPAHLLDYVRVILKRLWLIVGVFLLVVGAVAFGTWRATEIYQATALINVKQPNVIHIGGVEVGGSILAANQSQIYRQTQFKLLRQRSTVLKMIEKYRMDTDHQEWKEFEGMDREQIARAIVGKITVVPDRDSTLVRVSVEDSRRNLVHRIANALVYTFEELQQQQTDETLGRIYEDLGNRFARYEQHMGVRESSIQNLLEENQTDQDTFPQKLTQARERLQRADERIETLQVDLYTMAPAFRSIDEELSKSNGDLSGLYYHDVLKEDGRIQQMEMERTLREQELEDLIVKTGPEHDDVIELKAALAALSSRLDNLKEQVLRQYHRRYREMEERKAHFETLRTSAEQEFRQLSAVKRNYDLYVTEIDRLKREAQKYDQALEKFDPLNQREDKPIVVEEAAQQPWVPIRPDKQMNMILGIVFGLLAGVAIAFFLEYMDDTVKTKEELSKITEVPLFGVIPNIQARKGHTSKKDLYAYNQPKSTISEAFRGIRTAISYSSTRKENQVYLLTSAGPKEGKTTIAINVATVMAYSGTRTLIVDADLRKPRIHKSFDLTNTVGLSNLIIGNVPVEEAIQSCEVENLFVLPSGPIPPNPSELLGRERMVELLEELRGKFDRILIDTPPIGAVTDAAVLGRVVDSVIVVVHAGKTRKKLIERGLEQLQQIDVDVSGVILNNLKLGRKRYYPGYYHYYYYYSSYYGSDDDSRPSGKKKDAQKV